MRAPRYSATAETQERERPPGALIPFYRREDEGEASAALEVLDRFLPGILMIRPDGTTVWMNREAARMVRDRELQLPITRISRDRPSARRVTIRDGRLLMITTVPLDSSRGTDREPSHVAIATMADQDSVTVPARCLELLFDLTPAEARVAVAITEGRTPAETADELHVSSSTVRSQLKAIFGKMGVRRQPELVRRVLAIRGVMLDLNWLPD